MDTTTRTYLERLADNYRDRAITLENEADETGSEYCRDLAAELYDKADAIAERLEA